MKRLTQWIDDGEHKFAVSDMTSHKIGHNDCLNKLAEYEDLEERGWLRKLPCAIGDTLWAGCCFFNQTGEPYPCKVTLISITSKGGFIGVSNEKSRVRNTFPFKAIGQSIFYKREEAKAAIALEMFGLKDKEIEE